MFRITKIMSGAQAAQYYTERDDYYLNGKDSARWLGSGAALAGLDGSVDPRDLRRILNGEVCGQQVGSAGTRTVKTKDGEERKIPGHQPGHDGTFSAPKGISVVALIGGDTRLIEAHDESVADAIAYLEQYVAITRQRGKDGAYDYENVHNLIVAAVRHVTNRNGEPQLHTHALLANLLRVAGGDWRSLDSRSGLYAAMVEAGNVYAAGLARRARACGYSMSWHVNDSGAIITDIEGLPQSLLDGFSTRSAEIDAELRARGIDPATASAQARNAASLATRKDKDHTETPAQTRARWRAQSRALGYDPDGLKPADRAPDPAAVAAAADAAVASASESLSEREARFTERSLLAEARVFGQGRADDAALRDAVKSAHDRGELFDRQTLQPAPGGTLKTVTGYTTARGVDTERRMLAAAARVSAHAGGLRIGETANSLNTDSKIDDLVARIEGQTGYAFTDEQKAALTGIAQAKSGLTILDGKAGTAKTSSVLLALSESAQDAGQDLRALAPTNSAAKTLGDALGTEGHTVESWLNSRPDPAGSEGRVIIVDEAGMLSARDMKRLLERADREHAHVVLTGDVRQIGSVGAGAALRQVETERAQDTYALSEIKRQSVERTREAVEAASRGDVRASLQGVDVHESKDRDEGIRATADDYMQSERDGKQTLAVALTTRDRDELNRQIQARREAAGEVRNAREFAVLRPKGWTAAQRRDAARYSEGDIISPIGRGFKNGPGRGETATVERVEGGMVVARTEAGKEWRFDPERTTRYTVADRASARIGEGDRIVAKGNVSAIDEHGEAVRVKNNDRLDVVNVGADGTLETRTRDGKTAFVDATHGARIDLGYATTADSSQGQTVDHVSAYLSSGNKRLLNQQRSYVALSRARESVTIHTDDREKLAAHLETHTGQKETALQGRDRDQQTRDPAAREPSRTTQERTADRDQRAAPAHEPTRAETRAEARSSAREAKAAAKAVARAEKEAEKRKPFRQRLREAADRMVEQHREKAAAYRHQQAEAKQLEWIGNGSRDARRSINKHAKHASKHVARAYGVPVKAGMLRRALETGKQRRARQTLDRIEANRRASIAKIDASVARSKEVVQQMRESDLQRRRGYSADRSHERQQPAQQARQEVEPERGPSVADRRREREAHRAEIEAARQERAAAEWRQYAGEVKTGDVIRAEGGTPVDQLGRPQPTTPGQTYRVTAVEGGAIRAVDGDGQRVSIYDHPRAPGRFQQRDFESELYRQMRAQEQEQSMREARAREKSKAERAPKRDRGHDDGMSFGR